MSTQRQPAGSGRVTVTRRPLPLCPIFAGAVLAVPPRSNGLSRPHLPTATRPHAAGNLDGNRPLPVDSNGYAREMHAKCMLAELSRRQGKGIGSRSGMRYEIPCTYCSV
jgi:hypothetical protein